MIYLTNDESAFTLTMKSAEWPGSRAVSDITPDLYINFEPSINVESIPINSVFSDHSLYITRTKSARLKPSL